MVPDWGGGCGGGGWCFPVHEPTNQGRTGFHAARSLPSIPLGFRSGAVVAGVLSGSCLVPLRVPVMSGLGCGWLAAPMAARQHAFRYPRPAGDRLVLSHPERQLVAADPRGLFGFVSELKYHWGFVLRSPPSCKLVSFLAGVGSSSWRPRGNFRSFLGNIFP